ncbi:type IV pilus assembly protein PilN [Desulfurella multipotens]|uniref:Type IV pilus assembly protein PilN n=1 Tax=Desulfurella multipotens TaxID=79269 RepID=A0A1G6I324_9BACT|nr:PilN domain-containing protein [Desulfurella multipotens]SDC00136.1 type IV pilus assembly protein PilN [Desulfurella multipotens]
MIEINLLTSIGEKPKQKGLKDNFWIILLLVVLFEVAVMFGVSAFEKSKIKHLEEKRNYLSNLSTKIKAIQNDQQKANQLINTISKLEHGKNLPIEILYALSDALPNNVWLTRVEKQANTLNISASSLDIDSISIFMNNLLSQKIIKDVRFNQGVTKTNDQKQNIYQFTLICELR